jgi:uncharacterized phiE125 gp8 family phage protein
MALPTLTDLKAYLRVQTTAEDTVLTAILTSATAAAENELGRPIAVTARTFIDECDNRRTYTGVRALVIPPECLPIDLLDASSQPIEPTVTDADGTVLDPDVDFRVTTLWDPLLRARPGITFSNPPYTVSVLCGLAADPEYATKIEPAIFQAILDIGADLYQRRNPAAGSETAGGGISATYSGGLPARARDLLAPWKAVRAW